MTASLPALLARRAADRGRRPALRHRQGGAWHDVSIADWRDAAWAVASRLIDAGVRPGDRVGLWSANCIEWPLIDLGVQAAGAVTVPVHAGLPAAAAAAQLADAGAVWLFAAGPFAGPVPSLRGVGPLDVPRTTPSDEVDRRVAALAPGDLATLIYTSGTTGEPKGVALTHGNLLANVAAVHEVVPFAADATLLNVLPLSHAYARTSDLYRSLASGATLALAESPATFRRDLAEVRPHHLHAVPRLYEKVLAEAGGDLRDAFGDRAVWLMSGGAPLPSHVTDAYTAAGLPLLEGYGLTEASPVVSSGGRGTVGRPLPGLDVRLAADGELLVRGPSVMAGYWNRPDATAAALRDGWLHTGDVAALTPAGELRITGRKSEIIVLSTGRKVWPAPVEALLAADPLVEQAVVFGDGRPSLAALVWPRWDAIPAGVDVQALVIERVATATAGLAPWERVRAVGLLPGPLTVEAGELTVSLKPRRAVVVARHSHAVP